MTSTHERSRIHICGNCMTSAGDDKVLAENSDWRLAHRVGAIVGELIVPQDDPEYEDPIFSFFQTNSGGEEVYYVCILPEGEKVNEANITRDDLSRGIAEWRKVGYNAVTSDPCEVDGKLMIEYSMHMDFINNSDSVEPAEIKHGNFVLVCSEKCYDEFKRTCLDGPRRIH